MDNNSSISSTSISILVLVVLVVLLLVLLVLVLLLIVQIVQIAVLRVLSDILLAVDRGDLAALVLLDLSAAFDTVDHAILLQRLESSFGIADVVLDWFRSYLSGRTQFVRCGGLRSSAVPLICGVPQGSVLGPVLFILYVADLAALIQKHDLSPHQYADDTQIYGSCSPSHVDEFSTKVSGCVNDVAGWMQSNRLQLNPEKTEFLWCSTCRRQHQLPTATLTIGSTTVAPVPSVRDLGIFVDSDLVMRTHVCQTVSRCFAALRQLRSIRHLVSATVFQSLVAALVLCRLDYGNGTLVGLPAYLINRLQSVQNAAARLIFRLRRYDHITDALVSLHWLRVPERIVFKVAVQTYRALQGDMHMLRSIFGSSPPSPTRRPDKDSGLHPPIVCLFRLSDFLLLDVTPSLLLVLAFGTIYLRTLPPYLTYHCLHLTTYFAFPTLI